MSSDLIFNTPHSSSKDALKLRSLGATGSMDGTNLSQ